MNFLGSPGGWLRESGWNSNLLKSDQWFEMNFCGSLRFWISINYHFSKLRSSERQNQNFTISSIQRLALFWISWRSLKFLKSRLSSRTHKWIVNDYNWKWLEKCDSERWIWEICDGFDEFSQRKKGLLENQSLVSSVSFQWTTETVYLGKEAPRFRAYQRLCRTSHSLILLRSQD